MRTRRPLAWLVFCVSVTSVALGRAAGVPVGQGTGALRPGDTKSLDVPPVLPAELDIARRARVILASKDVWNSRDQGFCPPGAVRFSIYCGLSEAGRANGDVAALNAALQEARLVVWDLVVSREYDHPLTDYNNESSTTFGDVERLLRWLENRLVKRLASGQRTGTSARPDDSFASPPARPSDLAIAKEARRLLNDSNQWNSRDTRDCPTAARSLSFYCALVEASDRVTGDLEPRGALMQEARFAVDAVARSRRYEHRLMDFNNDPSVGFSGVQRALEIVESKLQERIATGE